MNKKGFTLIELMVAMAIIAVLSVLIFGAITVARRTASETTHRANANSIRMALEAQFSRTRTYPTILAGQTFVQAASTLGVTISTGGGVCAGAQNGGGTVTSAAAGYSIFIARAGTECATVMETITGP